MSFPSFEAIKLAIEEKSVVTVSMATLRVLSGYGRLGPHVCSQISALLAANGIAHYPEVLPHSQHERVRLFAEDGLMNSILHVARDLDGVCDGALHALEKNPGAALMKIRKILDAA